MTVGADLRSHVVVPLTYRNTSWHDDANCATVGVDVMFPPTQDRQANQAAKKVCAACPVIGECREYALSVGMGQEPDGVFGGLTVFERREVLKAVGGPAGWRQLTQGQKDAAVAAAVAKRAAIDANRGRRKAQDGAAA